MFTHRACSVRITTAVGERHVLACNNRETASWHPMVNLGDTSGIAKWRRWTSGGVYFRSELKKGSCNLGFACNYVQSKIYSSYKTCHSQKATQGNAVSNSFAQFTAILVHSVVVPLLPWTQKTLTCCPAATHIDCTLSYHAVVYSE